ncbi:uncharacterized protein LOC132031779 [Lycium ferocissimum]|uniref:uncharacterized protein LOC132031779 n=1 Tax=Lycium ferocissimum TaxID=112874 RepID=UPI002815E974|nr:uncharacterized protein LOC132031779 [Lycium ferocissimum]
MDQHPPTPRHRDVPTTTQTDDLKLLRQDLQDFKKSVFVEFTDLRKYMDDNYKKVFEAIKGNNSSEKAADSEAPFHQYEVGIQSSPEYNQRQHSAIPTSTDKHDLDGNKCYVL